ncbi:MAG: hypothetical protein JO324_08205 [Candidatus Eremiobacteraeota bacterium]|nr:hypothetical protein [Candidatus Eremiobacteraeota bacterium]
MDDPNDDVIRKMKVREVAAVFRSRNHRDTAVEALLTHGFDRADIDLLANHDEVISRLGGVLVPAEELADIPVAPRRTVIDRADVNVTMVLVTTLAACGGGFAVIWYFIDSDKGPFLTMLMAILAALVAGGATAAIIAQMLRRWRDPEEIASAYGLVIWVRVKSPEQETLARKLLREHGGEAIHMHEVDLVQHRRDIPLSSLRPDPWLGDERLGEP